MINISTSHAKRYGLTVLLSALLVMGVTIVLNVIVDPYAMYRLSVTKGFNSHKPAVYHRVRLAKAYDVRRIAPRTIILGTSRTHLGIRPSHEAWPVDSRPVYNLAFDGATTKEMYYYLRHAQAVQPLRRVLLGLDTYHLTTAPGTVRPDFDEQLLLDDRSVWSKGKMYLADLKLLISFDTLMESIATIRAQDQSPAEWFAADGQRLGEVFFHQPGEHFQTLGPRAYFDEIDKQEVGYKLEWRIPAKSRSSAKQAPDMQADGITSLGYIQRIVEFCRANNIELLTYITPSHAHQMEISAATGEWQNIENGKRALVQILADEARKHPEQAVFPLYDFSGYSSVTTETLPPVGSRDELKYYWESSHFKDKTGNLVLNRIFNQGSVPVDFGVRLTSETIDGALAVTRAKQQAYRATHPEDIALIQRYITDYKNEHQIPQWGN